jgi:hypothetical protein
MREREVSLPGVAAKAQPTLPVELYFVISLFHQ